MAAANGHCDILSQLLKAGAVRLSELMQLRADRLMQIEYQSIYTAAIIPQGLPFHLQNVSAANEEGNTALHWACVNHQTKAVDILLEAGASASALNKYENPSSVGIMGITWFKLWQSPFNTSQTASQFSSGGRKLR